MPESPKYPHVSVQLSGEDGNAMSIMARTRRALLDAGVPPSEVSAYLDDAMSGDYEHVLAVTANTVTVS